MKQQTMDERQTRAAEHIERTRQAIRRMRGKYRLDIPPSHRAPVEARNAIAALWLVLGVTDSAPNLHGDPLERNLKAFRGGCVLALELLDDIWALIEVQDTELAGQLLPELFSYVNGLWRCCVGLKGKKEREAESARVEAGRVQVQAEQAAHTAVEQSAHAAHAGAK